MKKLRKILIFVLCAVAVLCTVGFSNVKAASVWNLVSDASTLKNGDKIIIATLTTEKNKPVCYALGKAHSKNKYFEKALVTTNDNQNQLLNTSAANILTLEASGSKFKIKSNTGKYLGEKAEKSLGEFALTEKNVTFDFTISISGNNATIKGSNPIKYNISAPRFTTYSSGQNAIRIYKQVVLATYTVKYVTNCPTSIADVTLDSGSTLTEPIISNNGYTLAGWYTEAEFTNKFDFTTKVTSNLTLYAKWVKTESYTNFVLQNTHSSLNVNYTITDVVGDKAYNLVTEDQTDWSGTYLIGYIDTTTNKVAISDLTDNTIDINTQVINNSIAYSETLKVNEITIVKSGDKYTIKTSKGFLNNGGKKTREIIIGQTSQNYSITFVDGTPALRNTDTNKTLCFNITIDSNTKVPTNKFRFYASANGDIKNISLFKLGNKVTHNYEISNVDLRFGTMVPVADYDAMVAEGAKFGVTLQKGTNAEQTFECAPVRVNEKGIEDAQGNFYQFAVVLTNVPSTDYAVSVTGKCYVEINGVKHYMVEKTTSVKATAQDYLNLTDKTAIEAHLGALTELAK